MYVENMHNLPYMLITVIYQAVAPDYAYLTQISSYFAILNHECLVAYQGILAKTCRPRSDAAEGDFKSEHTACNI